MVQLDWLPRRLLIGLSGGADSVALLLLLLDTGRQLTAVHVHHGLRGDDADADEAFVQSLCRQRDVPLLCFHAVPPEHPSEAWARETRYDFFRQAMHQTQADALVLAHHQNDQAETMLLHLLRGAGLQGLTGMRRDMTLDGMRILRPLLDVPRQALQEELLRRGQPWREDGSNADRAFLRNALRLDVLPAMEHASPGAARRMAQTSLLLQADLDALETLTEQFLRQHDGTQPYLPLTPLMQQPLGLQRRILRRWRTLVSPGAEALTQRQTDALRALLSSPPGSRCNLPGDLHGYRGWTHLHLIHPQQQPQASETVFDPVHGAQLGGLHLIPSPFDGWPGDGLQAQAIPLSMLSEPLTLRFRRPGDWMRPYGLSGRKRLQDVLVDRRIDAPFRARIPLLCRGSEVLLAAGVGAGDVPACTDQHSHILLRWNGRMPWQHKTLTIQEETLS